MAPPIADGESSPTPAANDCFVEVAAVEEPDEVEPEVNNEAVEPEKDSGTGAEPDGEMEDPDEDPNKEEEDEENAREEAEEPSDNETMIEPLSVLNSEEVQEGEEELEEPEEKDDEELSEVDEEYKEVNGGEHEETEKGADSVMDGK